MSSKAGSRTARPTSARRRNRWSAAPCAATARSRARSCPPASARKATPSRSRRLPWPLCRRPQQNSSRPQQQMAALARHTPLRSCVKRWSKRLRRGREELRACRRQVRRGSPQDSLRRERQARHLRRDVGQGGRGLGRGRHRVRPGALDSPRQLESLPAWTQACRTRAPCPLIFMRRETPAVRQEKNTP